MTDKDPDELMLSLKAGQDRIEQRLDGIETRMLTIDDLAAFMRETFGEMLSEYRIQRGLRAVADEKGA